MTRRQSRSTATIPGAPSARWGSTPPSSRATTRPISFVPGRATGEKFICRTICEREHAMNKQVPPPKPAVLVEGEPFIPYLPEEKFDPRLKPIVEPYKKRMGFLPNALKLHAYRPEIAETLWRLNSNI